MQLIVIDAAPLLELDEEISTCTPPEQILLLELQLPLRQSLFIKHKYWHNPLTQLDPNGQLLSIVLRKYSLVDA